MSDSFWEQVNRSIVSATGTAFSGKPRPGPGGGCINQTWLLESGSQRFFVKTQENPLPGIFAAEAAGLQALIDTQTIRVPGPVCHGCSGNRSWLVLEWLDLKTDGNWSQLGHKLAQLHQIDVGNDFGWERDNFIGRTPQKNKPERDWTLFFGSHRLLFQASLARQKGAELPQFNRLMAALPEISGSRNIRPALLHGDLWAGNVAFTLQGEPVLFDVAVYRGDPETDLAMTGLFGGFPSAFYRAYHAVIPQDRGHPERRTLYNLYHILNHFNLFGGNYLEQANQMIRELLS